MKVAGDRVIFKTDKRGDFKGDVTAFLPDYDDKPGEITCYCHIGQHSTASLDYFHSSKLRHSTPEEYAPLLAELKSIGYKPVIRRRLSYKH